MNCLEFRRLTLIDPSDENEARLSHRDSCDRCARFVEQMLRQDELIREATAIEPSDGFAARILLNQSLQHQSRRPTRMIWLSLAASFFLALAIVPALNKTEAPFADALASHSHAHDILQANFNANRSSRSDIAQTLASVNTALPTAAGNIIHASTCVVEGQVMAHLLIEDNNQQYVLYLIPEQLLENSTFSVNHWSGRTVTVGQGRSLAVMNRSGTGLVEAADRFSRQFNQPLSSGDTI
jgi:hypothetical protein